MDTTDDEFALFIHWARSLRLDPLRRQVHAFVFNKHDPKKRRLSLVTSIEGFRAIAARTSKYRPDENEPAFIADDKAETNPAGLVSCAVRVWQYAHGQCLPITGVARWDEFAPLKTVWVDNEPTERKVLDKSGRWADMPFLMLAKCAKVQAIRKGWPEDLSNTFVGEEIEQAALILNGLRRAIQDGL
jgi:phage recombination protein Bet